MVDDGSPLEVQQENPRRWARSTRHFYEDGNVCLLVGGPEIVLIFRVFKGILSQRSEIFRDTFSIGSCVQQLAFQGVPAVELQDDPVLFSGLLDYIFPHQTVNQPMKDKPLKVVFGLLSLARKYVIDDIAGFALEELDRRLPSSVDTLSRRTIYSSTAIVVDTILACRAHNLDQYLPLAFYTLAMKNHLRETWKESSRLDREDRLRVHLGGARLKERSLSLSLTMLELDLCGSAGCESRRRWAVAWVQRSRYPLSKIPSPVFSIVGADPNPVPRCPNEAIKACEQGLTETYDAMWRGLYEALPVLLFLDEKAALNLKDVLAPDVSM